MSESEKIKNLKKLPKKIIEKAREVGLTPEGKGKFLQLDNSCKFSDSVADIEIMPISEALKKYKWIKDYFWGIIKKDKDNYTKSADIESPQGYFVRVLPGKKIKIPVQACMMISKKNLKQIVHNIIIAEKDSELNLITGCTTVAEESMHIGVSEFYVKENAKINFTMIHNWNKTMDIKPRSAASVENNGIFISNYISLQPVKDLQMYPSAHLNGKNSKAFFNSLVLADDNSFLDIGSEIILKGENSSGEIKSRNVVKKGGNVIARGRLVGESAPCKAHLECQGLLLSDNGKIHAIPELIAKGKNCEMSHEAAIGKIKSEELGYLMSRGLSKEKATSLIIRGFLDPDLVGIPENLKEEIKKIIKEVAEKGF